MFCGGSGSATSSAAASSLRGAGGLPWMGGHQPPAADLATQSSLVVKNIGDQRMESLRSAVVWRCGEKQDRIRTLPLLRKALELNRAEPEMSCDTEGLRRHVSCQCVNNKELAINLSLVVGKSGNADFFEGDR